MDPTRMTFIAAGAGVLLAGLIVGPIALMATLNDDGGDGGASQLQEGSQSMPAAQEAFARGLTDEEPAYLNDRMRMTMRVLGVDDVVVGDSFVHVDPETDEFEFRMMIDVNSTNEAYGYEETEEDLLFSDGLLTDGMFDMHVVKLDNRLAISLGEDTWAWRDHSLDDEPFDLFAEDEEDDSDMTLSTDMPNPLTTDELRHFIEANDTAVVHDIEASSWEGTPTWKVSSTLSDDDAEGEGVFHFRQSDMAPLALDMTMQVVPDDGMYGQLQEGADGELFEDFELKMEFRFEYGSDFEIEFPTEFTRLSVTPDTTDETSDQQIMRTLSPEHDELVPLDELEIHVVVLDEAAMMWDPFSGPIVDEVLAELDLSQRTNTTQNGYHVRYEDMDSDGFLSSGDWFTATSDEEDAFWSNDTHRVALLVYDDWSDGYEGTPAPGVPLIIGLVTVAVAALRRRRKTP